MRTVAAFVLFVLLGAPLAQAGGDKPDARDRAAIQGCIKAHTKDGGEGCIGKLADPCLARDGISSTADMVECSAREHRAWDDILNDTYRRLRARLDDRQKVRLRAMQRAWLESRARTCAFYGDFFQGTMARPMAAACMNSETARRALFLLGFLHDADVK